MAVTPNYHWPTPDDVRAFALGAADMRTLGNAIDASVKGIDTAYKAADSSIRSDFAAADNAIKATATDRWNGQGGTLTRTGSQATASNSTDVTLAMDGTRELRGTATGGVNLGLTEAGLYVIVGQMEVGVGGAGELAMSVRTVSNNTALCSAAATRTGALRLVLSCSAVWSLNAGVNIKLTYSTNVAMTITAAALTGYRIGAV